MKLMIIDGNSIVNRAFYGVRPLNAPDGTPTNAVYGFLTIFQRIYDEQKPDAVCVSFDLKAPTFRHKKYDGYKAQRKPMPEELAVQMPLLKEVLDDMGIRRYELEGYEADDILGTAAAICEQEDWNCVIVTGDKDSLQLISDKSYVCNVKTRMGQTETIIYDPSRFREEYGFEPERMVDLKSLMGDMSDNIPGVPGVGEKTALELIRRFGTLDAIYSNLETLDIKEGVRKKLAAGEDSARMSYWLATIDRHIPLEFDPDENIWNKAYKPELYTLFKRLGFNKFIEKWQLTEGESPAPVENAEESLSRVENLPVQELSDIIRAAERIAVWMENGLDSVEICDGKAVYTAAAVCSTNFVFFSSPELTDGATYTLTADSSEVAAADAQTGEAAAGMSGGPGNGPAPGNGQAPGNGPAPADGQTPPEAPEGTTPPDNGQAPAGGPPPQDAGDTAAAVDSTATV